jgi:hypothetical protein
LVGGAMASQIRPPKGTTCLLDWDALENWVNTRDQQTDVVTRVRWAS